MSLSLLSLWCERGQTDKRGRSATEALRPALAALLSRASTHRRRCRSPRGRARRCLSGEGETGTTLTCPPLNVTTHSVISRAYIGDRSHFRLGLDLANDAHAPSSRARFVGRRTRPLGPAIGAEVPWVDSGGLPWYVAPSLAALRQEPDLLWPRMVGSCPDRASPGHGGTHSATRPEPGENMRVAGAAVFRRKWGKGTLAGCQRR